MQKKAEVLILAEYGPKAASIKALVAMTRALASRLQQNSGRSTNPATVRFVAVAPGKNILETVAKRIWNANILIVDLATQKNTGLLNYNTTFELGYALCRADAARYSGNTLPRVIPVVRKGQHNRVAKALSNIAGVALGAYDDKGFDTVTERYIVRSHIQVLESVRRASPYWHRRGHNSGGNFGQLNVAAPLLRSTSFASVLGLAACPRFNQV